MFEKNLQIGYLLDFYGELLSDRKHSVMEMYYNEDLSLAEIANEIGISRQGVRDIIKKCEDELFFYEEKLGLFNRFKSIEACVSELKVMSESQALSTELKSKIDEILQALKI